MNVLLEKHLQYWTEGAADALDTADKLFASKKYHHSLFFLHLALEKIIKAVYVQKKDAAAPAIHDLVSLSKRAEIKLDEKQIIELVEISSFNITARYDDYKFKFYKRATAEFSKKWLKIGKRLYHFFSKLLR